MTKRIRTTRRLEVWLKDTSVALFVLNLQRRLVFFNVGCERISGWLAAEMLGKKCEYLTDVDTTTPASILAALAAPSEVWNGSSITATSVIAPRDAEIVPCEIHFYPLTDAELKVQAVLGIIQPNNSTVTAGSTAHRHELHAELATLRHQLQRRYAEAELIGRSAGMRRTLQQLQMAQTVSRPVLFVGEEGTGRQYMARLIHQANQERQAAFVPIDCRRILPDHLLNMLHRMVNVHLDDGLEAGTVYLNHVESVPRDIQQLVVEMIDSTRPNHPRVMAASTQPLEPLLESEQMLAELFYRLTSIQIDVLPLRRRAEDLALLAQYFLEQLNRDSSKQVDGFHSDVWAQLQQYNWPGNVRELKKVVEQSRENCAGGLIEAADLSFGFRMGADAQSVGPSRRPKAVPLDPLLLDVEREQIELALAEARFNKARAADLLGITRPRLYRRMEILGIVDREGRADEEVGG